MTSYLGIDPGLSGGVAVVGDVVEAYKMPATEKDLWDLITSLHARLHIEFALIEELHALPAAVEERLGIKRGSVATAKLMQHYGSLRMALIASGIPFDEKVAATWQRIMACRTHGDKNVSKARAQQLFPEIKITHATADALLIASAARILFLNSRGWPPVPQPKPQREPKLEAARLPLFETVEP